MFDWSTYLDVADRLVFTVGGEAAERSASSRAYYACYGTAWGYAKSKGAPLTGRGIDHKLVWNWFLVGSERGPIHVEVGTNGRRLKEWRLLANDGRPDFVDVAGLARVAVSLAQQVLTDLAALP